MLKVQTAIYGCLMLTFLFGGVSSAPQPIDSSLRVTQGSGKFIVLNCSVASDCSDTTFLVTGLPSKGQLFRAQGSPNVPTSFTRSELIQATGLRLSNRIVYYLPFHEVYNDVVNTILSDSFKYKADPGSSEAKCLVEVVYQQLLPVGGGSGYSLLFDGIDDIVVTPVDSWFPASAFTVMLWIRVYDGTKQATIFSFFGTKGPVFEIFNPRDLTCIVGFSVLAPTKIDVSDGKWHHVAATWSSTSKTCRIIVDATISAVAVASDTTPSMENTGTIVLGNRQACQILDTFENRAAVTESRASKQITVGPLAGNTALNFSTTPSALLMQHIINRAYGSAAPIASTDNNSPLHEEPYVNSRQRSDYLLCRCTGGCFSPNLAFSGEMDDVRLYSFEKTIAEIRVESKFVFSPVNHPNVTRPQMEQQFFGLQLWLTFDNIVDVIISDSSGRNRKSFRGSNATRRFPCHKKREPFQVVSSTGVLGGTSGLMSIGTSSRIEIKLPGIIGIGNTNVTLRPRFRFDKKSGGGTFYNAACGFSGTLTVPMVAQSGSLVGVTGCVFYTPNQIALLTDVLEYSISNVEFGTGPEINPDFVVISYSMTFYRESSVIPSNYLVGLQAEAISVVKLMITRTDLSPLNVAVTAIPKYANIWIAMETRCADVPQCQFPLSTLSWETSGTSFIDTSSLSKFSDWKYVQPPFGTPLYQSGPKLCDTDRYFTPELILPSTCCKIGKYYLKDAIFNRPSKGNPMFLNASKWNWVMWEVIDFSSTPYGDSLVNSTLQGVIVECLVYDGSLEVPMDNSTSCYVSNCFPPDSRILAQSALPTTPAAVLRAVLSQKTGKLESLLRIGAQFDRLAINAAAALGNVDILKMLLSTSSPRWDYDAIELADKLGSWAARDYLQAKTSSQGYEGIRTGAKCLVRGDSAVSFTGFVTVNPYFLASGVAGVSGQLGALKLLWSKAQLTDRAPNFPVSRLQTVSFWGLMSRAPRPDGKTVLKDVRVQGFQYEPVVITPATAAAQNTLQTCLRMLVNVQPKNGHLYNVDDSFGLQRCKDSNFSKSDSGTVHEIVCREFGMDVYFVNTLWNQSTFSNSPKRPIVYPSQIMTPVYKPMSGVKIRRNQDLISQKPIGILNASTNNITG
jgi:hypothetical protein